MSALRIYMTTVIANPLSSGPRREDMPPETETIERWRRLAYLLWCNGGKFDVSTWGTVDEGDFPWKQGLTMQEALELLHISAVVYASAWYEDTFHVVFQPLINQYIESVLRHQKAHSRANPKRP